MSKNVKLRISTKKGEGSGRKLAMRGVKSIGTGSLAAVRPTIHIAPWALSVDAVRRLIWNSGP